MFKKILLFLVLILCFDIVYACDWQVEILSDTIFNSTEDFEFRYFINRLEGNSAEVNLTRNIETVYGIVVKSYGGYSRNIINYHTTSPLSPNLNSGIYLIKGEIFQNCSDTDLENNYVEKLVIILGEEEEVIGNNYTMIKINELLPDSVGNDSASMPDGEWVEFYNSGNESVDLENFGLQDNYGQNIDIYISDSNTNGTIIKSNDYLVVYMNGRSGFLNNDGFENISLYKDGALVDQVTYSGSSEGLSWSKFNNIWKKSLPSPGEKNVEENLTSYVKIEKVYDGSDNKVKFGETLMVRIKAFKANTTRSSVKVFIEDMEKSSFLVNNPGVEYNVMIPIKVVDNCDGVYEDGKYKVIVEGLGDSNRENVYLEGTLDCAAHYTEKTTEIYVPPASEKVINEPGSVRVNVYESSGIKEGRLGVYFLCFILILLVGGLIYERSKSSG